MQQLEAGASLPEIDEALAHASESSSRGDAWRSFVDQLLDHRLLLAASESFSRAPSGPRGS